MSKKAFLFSGQGAQCTGMALPILERFPRAAAYFEEADEICGFPLSELCKYGTEEELKETTVSQPAILLCSYGFSSTERSMEGMRIILRATVWGNIPLCSPPAFFPFGMRCILS